jgi:hypothetical protein
MAVGVGQLAVVAAARVEKSRMNQRGEKKEEVALTVVAAAREDFQSCQEISPPSVIGLLPLPRRRSIGHLLSL